MTRPTRDGDDRQAALFSDLPAADAARPPSRKRRGQPAVESVPATPDESLETEAAPTAVPPVQHGAASAASLASPPHPPPAPVIAATPDPPDLATLLGGLTARDIAELLGALDDEGLAELAVGAVRVLKGRMPRSPRGPSRAGRTASTVERALRRLAEELRVQSDDAGFD